MSYATSSAQPAQLYRYADVTGRIDHELAAEAGSLGACLRHFEATCREPGYTVNVSYLADALRSYAQAAKPVDRWVQAVGRGFERADQRSIAQTLAQWVTGILATLFRPRPGGSYSLIDRYTGLVLRPRGDSPLGLQSQVIIDRLVTTRPPYPTLWLAFSRTNLALRQAIWTIRFLILRFHWLQFRPPFWWPWIPFFPISVEVVPSLDWPLLSWPLGLTRPRPLPLSGSVPEIPTSAAVGEISPKPILDNDILYQTEPDGPDWILDTVRYETTEQEKPEPNPFTKEDIITVRDHIAAYGCLLTSYTMLLRSQGVDLSVADLYRINYELCTGDSDFGKSVSQGRIIVLFDLYPKGRIVHNATNGSFDVMEESDSFDVREIIASHGSAIVQTYSSTNDGHWVVVDRYDESTGLFLIRDPLKGKVWRRIPGDYKLTGQIKYLKRNLRSVPAE